MTLYGGRSFPFTSVRMEPITTLVMKILYVNFMICFRQAQLISSTSLNHYLEHQYLYKTVAHVGPTKRTFRRMCDVHVLVTLSRAHRFVESRPHPFHIALYNVTFQFRVHLCLRGSLFSFKLVKSILNYFLILLSSPCFSLTCIKVAVILIIYRYSDRIIYKYKPLLPLSGP